MQKLELKPKCDIRLRSGHHWVFSNEIKQHLDIEAGSVVEVVSSSGLSWGAAFYHPNSLIAARLLKSTKFDINIVRHRISNAIQLRQELFAEESSYRLVFGESDFLPGLIVDKYSDYLSVQLLSAGVERLKEDIVEQLLKLLPNTKGIIEKDISKHRASEGLEEKEEVLFGNIPELIEITENGLKLDVALLGGQKTGYFLDQKINRKQIKKYSKNKTVLDCFCNQGGFALNCATANAKSVVGVDISSQAIQLATNNASKNNLNNIEFIKYDVFDFLEESASKNRTWDIIILDPPAFTKSRKTLTKAIVGYSRVNKLALKCLKLGGILVSSSCSHHLTEASFLELISKEASKLGKQLRIIYRGMQSPDHPILSSMPETNYLKFLIFSVDG